MRAQAEQLLALGAGAVLIKGGHGGGTESVDLSGRGWELRALRRAAYRHQKHPRHRLHAGLGDRRGSSQRACARMTRYVTPRPTSPLPSRQPTGSRSAPDTARCIIFSSGGERMAHTAAGAPGCFSGCARAKASSSITRRRCGRNRERRNIDIEKFRARGLTGEADIREGDRVAVRVAAGRLVVQVRFERGQRRACASAGTIVTSTARRT